MFFDVFDFYLYDDGLVYFCVFVGVWHLGALVIDGLSREGLFLCFFLFFCRLSLSLVVFLFFTVVVMFVVRCIYRERD